MRGLTVPKDDATLSIDQQPQDCGKHSVTHSEKLRARVVICNRKGLHARASARFVKTADSFDAVVTVIKDERTKVGGTSIMSLLTLAAGPGTELVLETEGPEREQALAALVALVGDGFGED
jgi:phosphocarrier protein